MRLIGIVFLLVLGFAGGYYIGTNRLTAVKQDFSKLKDEMMQKAARLEREVANLRHRDNIIVAKDRLQDAQRALTEKNFGEAQKAVQEAQEKIREAQKLAGPAEKEKYNAVSNGLNDISNDLAHSARPQLREKLQKAEKDLNQLVEK